MKKTEDTLDEVEYIKAIIIPIIENPDKLDIEKVMDDRGILLNVSAFGSDLGRIIGKEGQTANAIRHLVHMFGYKYQKTISVKVVVPRENNGERERR